MKKVLLLIACALFLGLPPTALWGALVDNGDGTVSDLESGLMWQKTPFPAMLNWEAALNYCETLVLPAAGYDDWHLPDANELQTLVDYSGSHPAAINTTFFPGTQDYDYWSSTTYDDYYSYVWTINFSDGRTTFLEKLNSAYVRAVRWFDNNRPSWSYEVRPGITGQGSINPGQDFFAPLVSSPVLLLMPYSGWHLESVDASLPGTLAPDPADPGSYTFTLSPLSGSGTVIANYIWDQQDTITDIDGDGIDDDWETFYFADLLTANCFTDYEGDGFADIFEYRNFVDNRNDGGGQSFDPMNLNQPFTALVDPACASGCFPTIGQAVERYRNEPVSIRLREADYPEAVVVDGNFGYLVFRGGFNGDFSQQNGFSTIKGSLTLQGATVVIEKIIIK